MSNRPERVAQLMRRELADILERRLRDPRVTGFVNITDVEVTGDLSVAKVYVSMLEGGEERERILQALHSATGFIRRELASRMGLREMPEVRFMLDASVERGARVDELLGKIKRGEPIEDEDESE